jgi:hypothetical protein
VPRAVTFVETMTGSTARCPRTRLPDWSDDPDGYDTAIVRAATVDAADSPATDVSLRDLTLEVDPTPAADDGLEGVVRAGTVRVGDRVYRVTGGRFVALAASPVRGRRMRYRIFAETRGGERIDLAGVKVVTGRPWRWWMDTSRMHVVVSTMGPESTAAAGTVRLTVASFARQLTTVRGQPRDVLRFVARFVARLVLPAGTRARASATASQPRR